MPEIILPHLWKPRDYQKPLYNYMLRGGKRAMAVWHRQAGKDETAMRITSSLMMQRKATYWHMFPKITQARTAMWKMVNPATGKRRIFEVFPEEIIAGMNEQSMMITAKNGSTWQLTGSDSYDNLVGSAPAGIVFSEWAIARQAAWAYFQPMLEAETNNGWAMFVTTPRGRNHAYDMSLAAKRLDGWHYEIRDVTNTGIIPNDKLVKIREELLAMYGEAYGEAMFNQEYLCSFDSAIAGSIFGAEMTVAEREGRICEVKPVKGYKVHTVWDLGNNDANVIIFFQILPDRINIIDCYADHYKSFEFYHGIMQSKGYDYGIDFLPHDGIIYESGTGRTRIETLIRLGRRCQLVMRVKDIDSHNAARLTLPRTYFDSDNCSTLIEAMRSYHTVYDDDKRMFLPEPYHDWSSDYAAAYRYLAMVWKERMVQPVQENIKEGLTTDPESGRQVLRINLLDRLNKKAKINAERARRNR